DDTTAAGPAPRAVRLRARSAGRPAGGPHRRGVSLGAGARLLGSPPARGRTDGAGLGRRRLGAGSGTALARSATIHDPRLAAVPPGRPHGPARRLHRRRGDDDPRGVRDAGRCGEWGHGAASGRRRLAVGARPDDRRRSRPGRAQFLPLGAGPHAALPRHRLVGEPGAPPSRCRDCAPARPLPRPTAL
ncbi:MAG: hypothetical protein AVDCRST_MAG88-682, partial [uncultured Thermomicrobiales bacterium]